MAIDTPAKIAILGAGPIGLEAALYARFLGYEVVVFEAGEVAVSVRRWGNVRMFTPFGMNRSSLGLAAIQAQDESYDAPRDDELLTGNEWVDRYLLPLSQTDLLADHLRLHSNVVSVGKDELFNEDIPAASEQGDFPFRILFRDASGAEHSYLCDAVLDCTECIAGPDPGDADCLEQKFAGLPEPMQPAPNFYILGAAKLPAGRAKSSGDPSSFLFSAGLKQIRDLFAIIGDRPTLDLYAGAHKLLR
jgi:hypothetical protein